MNIVPRQSPPRIHFVVPLGAGRIGDQLSLPSIARLDEAIKIAEREKAYGLIALGGYYPTWRQGKPYDTPGADLRYNYLRERVPSERQVIKIPHGFDTFQELIALRDVGHFYGVEKMIIVTHPEHVRRVKALSEIIFSSKCYPQLPVKYIVEVESGDLPSGFVDAKEEERYLDATLAYLKKRYPPNGIVPVMRWTDLEPLKWRQNHVELYTTFQAIYDEFHKEGRESVLYAVPQGKER